MSSLKHVLKTRTYRERSQPAARQKLGMLEKHKDYTLRARDYHKKQDAINALKEKAAFKNPDEFYFGMVHTKMKDGVHQKAAQSGPTGDELRAFKREDAAYVAMKRASERKKVERLRANLHGLDEASQNKRIIFVHPEDHPPPKRKRRSARPGAGADADADVDADADADADANTAADADADADADTEARVGAAAGARAAATAAAASAAAATVAATAAAATAAERSRRDERALKKQYAELEQRMRREEKLGKCLNRLATERALQGKGRRKKLKPRAGAPRQFKWRQERKK